MKTQSIGAVVAGMLATGTVARADHDHMAMSSTADDSSSSSFAASVSLSAASFSSMYYGGDYEGITPAASWTMGRFSVGASLPYYRLFANGLETYGVGDLVVHGQATVISGHDVQAGVMLAVSAPTGDGELGLGMGHPMAMPAAWGTWHFAGIVWAASLGYGRALAELSSKHDHGVWPLVEPMNMSEISWGGSGERAIARGVRAGARVSGGVPVGSLPGHERVEGAARVAWGTGRVDTAAELQAGLVGDPFTVRGVVSTALRF